ncbi:MAG: SBBP repeat-containing protein, partial [Bryobacteraceae bacterium]
MRISRRWGWVCLTAFLTVFPAVSPTAETGRPQLLSISVPNRALQGTAVRSDSSYGRLPLAFEPNVGQTAPEVRFLARGGGMTAFFTDAETVMVLSRAERGERDPLRRPEQPPKVERAVVRMKLAGGRAARQVQGLEKLPGISNYFIGNDPKKWRTDVPHYARMQYEGVYPGIDLVWYGNQRQLEYDFVVAPGADPRQIQVAYEGVESVGVEPNGELVLRTALGEVRQQRPRVYQEIGGKRVEVEARYAIAARNRVSFELARYDRKRELRIDPLVLVYSTYLGGSNYERVYGIAVDGAGSAYVTGYTQSTDFPTQSPHQATLRTAPGVQVAVDVFVTKLTPAGNALVYSTYLGGSDQDEGYGIAVDAAGSAYIVGSTQSTNFPIQSAYQATYQVGGAAFVTKLSPAGNALIYSTYLGGADGRGIAVDAAGSAYVTGYTQSSNFPTQSPYQATFQGYFDAFVTKLTPVGNALVYSTYLGGSWDDGGDGIAVDGAGSAYVTGYTGSTNFPTQSPYQATLQGSQNAFVTKLTPAGNALSYSTYLGG